MMLAGLGLLALGMAAGGLFPGYATVFFAFLLAGVGKTFFDPTWQAFVGENVPYGRRGLAVGVGEFSWAFSSLLGIPAIGLLMEKAGWRSPFFVLGLAGLFGAVALKVLLPGGAASPRRPTSFIGIWNVWRKLFRKRAAAGALGFAFFLCVANDNLFVVFEFTVVSFLSLATELVPEMQATMMSGYMVASSLGRVSGDFLGGGLWLWGGIRATCAASAAISMLGLVFLLLGLKGWPRRGGSEG